MADDDETAGILDGREQLVVLAESEVVDGRSVGARNVRELDLDSASRTAREVSGVDREPVGHVDHRVRALRELQTFDDPQRRSGERLLAERGTACAERSRHDEEVARPGPRASWDAVCASEGGYAEDNLRRTRRVSAEDRNAGLRDPCVELEHIVELRVSGSAERADQADGGP